MCNLEKLSLLCAGTTAYHPPLSSDNFSFGGERLTPAEVAGMLSGLNTIELALIYAKYLGDLASERKLWANVYEWAAGVAVRESWAIQRGQPVVANMAYIAVFEIVRPNRCGKCKGTGIIKAKACTQCAGSGFRPLSGRAIADAIGYHEATYRELWKSRYSSVFSYVQDIESRAVSRIRFSDRELA
jgi:hypothetical protein